MRGLQRRFQAGLRYSAPLRAFAAVLVLTVAVKIAGAVKTVACAHMFGAGDSLDAYLLAFLVPSFIGDTLSGAICPALVPALIEAEHSGGREEVIRLYADALFRYVLLLSAASVLGACAAHWLYWIAPGFSEPKLALTRRLLAIMLPLLPLSAAGAVWRSMLNAKNHFALAAISPVMTPVASTLSLFFAGPKTGIFALAAGTTTGGIAELGILIFALRSLGLPACPRRRGADTMASAVQRQYFSAAVGGLLLSGSVVVNSLMAASLGSGAMSLLNFGTRIPGVVIAVGPAALSTTILPLFSQFSAGRQWDVLRRAAAGHLLSASAIMAAVTAVLIFFSEPIVRLVFEHGAFLAGDARAVTIVQSLSFLQLPPAIAVAILYRLVASLKVNYVLLPVAAGGVVAAIATNLALMGRFGIAGIALSPAVVSSITLLTLGIYTWRRISALESAAAALEEAPV